MQGRPRLTPLPHKHSGELHFKAEVPMMEPICRITCQNMSNPQDPVAREVADELLRLLATIKHIGRVVRFPEKTRVTEETLLKALCSTWLS